MTNFYAYNPEFDNLTEQKQAATLANRGFAALACLHKYVGERPTFCTAPKYFLSLQVVVFYV
jgi:hypothetical protein